MKCVQLIKFAFLINIWDKNIVISGAGVYTNNSILKIENSIFDANTIILIKKRSIGDVPLSNSHSKSIVCR